MGEIKKIIKNKTETKYIEVPIEKEYYECSDGTVFESENLALSYQIGLDGELKLWKACNNTYVLEVNKPNINEKYIKYISSFIGYKLDISNMGKCEVDIENMELTSGLYFLAFEPRQTYSLFRNCMTIKCNLIEINEATQKIQSYRARKPL